MSKPNDNKDENQIRNLFLHNELNPFQGKGNSQQQLPVHEEFKDCYQYFQFFMKCFSFSTQMNHIHKYGKANSCEGRFDDWRKCFSARMIKDDEQRAAIYKKTKLYQARKESKNEIFVYKEQGSWDVELD